MNYLLLFCLIYAMGYKLPDNIQFCRRSQPDFEKCVAKNMRGGLEAFAHGNKELGVPELEPYLIEKMEITPNSNKSVSIHQIFTNIEVHGMTNSDVVHMEIEIDKGCSWIMDVVSPLVYITGEYEMHGKMMVFPINSNGHCNISQVFLRNRHTLWCERYQKNGKTHIRAINYTMNMQPERLIFDFKDLFPSNKDIEKEILKTLNENSIAIFKELKNGFEQVFSKVHIQVSNKVLSKIPLDSIFLPK